MSAMCCWILSDVVFFGMVHVTLSSFRAAFVSLSTDFIKPLKRNTDFFPTALDFALTLATACKMLSWWDMDCLCRRTERLLQPELLSLFLLHEQLFCLHSLYGNRPFCFHWPVVSFVWTVPPCLSMFLYCPSHCFSALFCLFFVQSGQESAVPLACSASLSFFFSLQTKNK